MINLFFMSTASYGGHVTFTVHLMIGLRALGQPVRLFKVSRRTEGFERNYGYGETYRNVSLIDAVKMSKSGDPCLITASNKPKSSEIDEMIGAGARMVIHDPAEFKHGWDWKSVERPIVIRKSMLQYFRNAVWLKHPYDSLFKEYVKPTGKWAAVSTSRIDFDKHTEIMLDANRLLEEADRIQIFGFENRIYTRFNLLPKYPEWKQSVASYPRELRYATESLCHNALFMCDMSIISGDGGGTQYTFLESIDAGCVVVVNRGWMIDGHVMEDGVNCIAVSDGEELASLIKGRHTPRSRRRIGQIATNARELLVAHDAKRIAKSWKRELCH